MKIVIAQQTVAAHDAIGNDIEMMYRILSKDHTCVVYADNRLNPHVEYTGHDGLRAILNDPDSLFLYHHSVFWEEGEQLLRQAKGRVVIRYHNITPSAFFESYNEHHFQQCARGMEQTKQLAAMQNAFWICDSAFNAEDIADVPENRKAILAPFNKIEEWAAGKPDEGILEELLYSRNINLLFVGRVAPNKGHLFLLDVLSWYKANYDSNIKLRIVGKFDDAIAGYNDQIRRKIKNCGLEPLVEFIGEINDATLTSYYLGSDFFVCASEHEGFCVPVPEAQYFGVPVLARNLCAVPETLGKNQLLLGDDPKEYAAAIHLLYNNPTYYGFLQEHGQRNFQNRFTIRQLTVQFQNIMKEIIKVKV